MPRSSEVVLAAMLLAAPAVGGTLAGSAPAPALARLSFVERHVEHSSEQGWHEAREGTPLRLGERIRTAADALARLDLPWMTMTISPASTVGDADGYLLCAVLEQGRTQLHSGKREILKLVTGEAEVRGQGWAVVRREGNATLVTSLGGFFFVEGAGKTVALPSGTGTIVREGKPPLPPQALPPPPQGLVPGSDPRYVAPGDTVSLSWTPRGAALAGGDPMARRLPLARGRPRRARPRGRALGRRPDLHRQVITNGVGSPGPLLSSTGTPRAAAPRSLRRARCRGD